MLVAQPYTRLTDFNGYSNETASRYSGALGLALAHSAVLRTRHRYCMMGGTTHQCKRMGETASNTL